VACGGRYAMECANATSLPRSDSHSHQAICTRELRTGEWWPASMLAHRIDARLSQRATRDRIPSDGGIVCPIHLLFAGVGCRRAFLRRTDVASIGSNVA